MRKLKLIGVGVAVFLGSFLTGASQLFAADAEMGLDVASSYVFRGVEVNDSWVAQPYVELSGFPGFFEGLSIGTWGNFDLHDGPGGSPESGEFSEVDFYGAYELPIGCDTASLSLVYTEYVYPNSELSADREAGLALEVDTILSPTFAVLVGVDGGIDEQVYMEFGLGHEEALTDDVTASIGGVLAWLVQPKDSTADDGLSYASVSAGLALEPFTVSITEYFETDDKVTTVDKATVGTIGVSYAF